MPDFMSLRIHAPLPHLDTAVGDMAASAHTCCSDRIFHASMPCSMISTYGEYVRGGAGVIAETGMSADSHVTSDHSIVRQWLECLVDMKSGVPLITGLCSCAITRAVSQGVHLHVFALHQELETLLLWRGRHTFTTSN